MTHNPESWDHSSRDEFYDYYARISDAPETRQRFERVCERILSLRKTEKGTQLDVLDIGCGPGPLSQIWASHGHHVAAIDVSEPFIQLARKRAAKKNLTIDFRIGPATALPWNDQSFDVICLPELLEHIAEWKQCLQECIRCIRTGGTLYLTTSNRLCPKQEEFNLPLYSWYPSFIKRYYERLAVSTRPELANYARYPAVNWFTFYQLQKFLSTHGFQCLDRFQILARVGDSSRIRALARLIAAIPGLRLAGHFATPGLTIVAFKVR